MPRILIVLTAVLCLLGLGVTATPGADKPVPRKQSRVEKSADRVDLGPLNVVAKRYQSRDLDTSAFTTVLDRGAIQASGSRDAFALLSQEGGVSFAAQFPGGISQGGMNGQISIRGLRDGELVLLDGMPMLEPTSGAYDLDMIPAAFLERVEMVKGAASALYGSRAMTGVVSLQTRRPGRPAAGGRLLYGSHNLLDTNAWYRNPYVFLGLSYQGFGRLDGVKKNYSRRSPYDTDLLDPRKYAALVSLRPLEPLDFTYLCNHQKSGYNRRYPTKPTYDYQDDQKLDHHYFSARYQKGGLKAAAFLHYTRLRLDYDYASPAKPDRHNDKQSYTTGLDAQHAWQWGGLSLLAGGSYLYEKQDEHREDLKYVRGKGYGLVDKDLDHQRHQASLFFLLERTFAERLLLSAGLRGQAVFNTETEAKNYYEPVPQLGALYRVTPHNSVYLNLGRAFRVPTFNQLYADFSLFAGNPKLNPEYGWTCEAGWKAAYPNFTLSLALFHMDYQDKIRYQYDPSQDRYVAANLDRFRSSGFEWKSALRLPAGFTFRFAGYLADPWEEKNGVKEQSGPRTQLVPALSFRRGPFAVDLRADILLERERYLDDYQNLHLRASYQLSHAVRLVFQADNLLDHDLVVYGNMTPGIRSTYEVLDKGMWVYGGVEVNFDLM